jgi:outer membrane phospholipase A
MHGTSGVYRVRFFLIALLTTLLISGHAGAQVQTVEDRSTIDEGLTSDLPNYVVGVPGGNGDERHLEFFVSIKYPLIARRDVDTDDDDGFELFETDGLYFTYSGLYDFYLGEDDPYDSSPVISRGQNPGLFLLATAFSNSKYKVRLGVYHESNGQTDDENDADEFFEDLEEFGITYATSGVSRSWNYGSALVKRVSKLPFRKNYLKMQLEARLYTGNREDEIWWEPGNDATIGQYDGLRGVLEYGPSRRLLLRADLKTGIRGDYVMNKVSYKATASWRIWPQQNLVLTGFYFNGYGREPSTYNLRNKYVGIGFEFRSARQD